MRGINRALFIVLIVCCSLCGALASANEYGEEDDYLSEDDYLTEEETEDYLEP